MRSSESVTLAFEKPLRVVKAKLRFWALWEGGRLSALRRNSQYLLLAGELILENRIEPHIAPSALKELSIFKFSFTSHPQLLSQCR